MKMSSSSSSELSSESPSSRSSGLVRSLVLVLEMIVFFFAITVFPTVFKSLCCALRMTSSVILFFSSFLFLAANFVNEQARTLGGSLVAMSWNSMLDWKKTSVVVSGSIKSF